MDTRIFANTAKIVSALVAVALVSCSERQASSDPTDVQTATATTATVGSVSISPTTDTVAARATTQYTATVKDPYGNVLSGQTITWTSSNPSVASVSSSGLATGIANGVVEITATASSKSGYAHLMVAGTSTIASITIAPATGTVAVGGTLQLVATARDANGNALSGYSFAWSTMNPSIASVNTNGLVSGLSAGSATITASAGGKVASAAVTVSSTAVVSRVVVTPDPISFTALGAVGQLTATAYNQNGQVMSGVAYTWKTLNSAVATVDTLGRVTARGVGTALIVSAAICCAKADTVTATVTQQVSSVAVSPHTASVQVGGNVTIGATAYDANKNPIPSTSFTWSSSNNGVASVNGGVVSGVAAGTAVIRAVSGTFQDSTVVTVTSVAPSPAPTGVVFQDNFDSGVLTGSQNGYKWEGTGSNPTFNINVVNDRAHSGAYSLRFLMRGKPSQCDDNSAEMPFDLGAYQREVWIEYYIYVQNGTEGIGNRYEHRMGGSLDSSGTCKLVGPNNNKYLMLWGDGLTGTGTRDGYNGPINVQWITSRSLLNQPTDLNLGDSRMSVQYGINGQYVISGEQGNKDPFFGPTDRGHWVQIRVYAKTADPGQSNGIMKMWKDGVLTSSITNAAHYMPLSSPNQNKYKHGYLMGWANSGFTKDTYVYIDDFRIIATNPGW